ncbi:DinB family protein [Glaciimonas sp. PAMC28666]|uniref:DinB family protein n=1 Tax=Glaciimonas sp. PAMC28666 TaxID=2807626 RepID=UPI0021084CCB|nr:DinB family protein [Glaciimonas sp. PAMC28666]
MVRCARTWRTNVARWQGFISGLEAQRFDTQLTYLRPSGEKTVTPFAPSLGHVFNHGTHHRGQLSAALTGMGYACPELDLIYRVREETNNGTGN